jgi:ABC-2 type transport system permease protein
MIKLLFSGVYYNVRSYFNRPGELLLSTFGSLINNCLYVYGIYFIALVSSSGGLSNSNILFFTTGLVTAAWGIINIIFGGLIDLGLYVETGELDSFLATPKHPLILIAISKSEVGYLADLIQGLIIIGFFGWKLGLFFAVKMLLGVVLVSLALLGVMIIGGSLSFFSNRGNSLSAMFIQMILSMSLFPMSTILKSGKKWILYLTPLLFSSLLPLKFITESNSSWFLYGLLGSISFLVASISFFNWGVKSYKSSNFVKLRG